MTMAETKSWLIGQYTGDPYRDVMATYNNAGSFTAASLCTVSVDGAILGYAATGTSSATGVYATSNTTAHAGGTVVFKGAASELFGYVVFHKPKR
jgi:hypothetical protein